MPIKTMYPENVSFASIIEFIPGDSTKKSMVRLSINDLLGERFFKFECVCKKTDTVSIIHYFRLAHPEFQISLMVHNSFTNSE